MTPDRPDDEATSHVDIESAEEEPASGLSRRTFLRGGAAVGALGTALLNAEPGRSPEGVRQENGVEILGPGLVTIHLLINGQSHELQVEPRVTLLDALRDQLQITGAKRVCDRGTCGACTIHLAGRSVYSCSVLAVEAEGVAITTIESLGTPDHMHPLQAAFVEEDAQQCGFCTPGMVMAAKAFLDRNPTPTLAQLEHGMAGNFCRCGTYAGIRRAVLSVAAKPQAKKDSHG